MTLRHVSAVAALLISAIVFSPTSARAASVCSQAPDSYSVDTSIAQWESFPKQKLTPGPEFTPRDEADMSAQFILAWNSSSLFVVVFVQDDVFAPSDSASSFWRGDSIQFAIHPDGSGPFFLGAANLTFGPKVIPTNVPDGYPSEVWDIPFRVQRTQAGMTYVVAIPWRYLGPLNPLSDDTFRFNVIVNDNDGGGRKGWVQLSNGIGDGADSGKFGRTAFRRQGDEARLRVWSDAPKAESRGGLTLRLATLGAAPGSRIEVTADGRTASADLPNGSAGVVAMKIEGPLPAGETAIDAKLVAPNGSVAATGGTAVTVFDANRGATILQQGHDALAKADKAIATATGQTVDYLQIRANCLRIGLRVAEMAQRGYKGPDGAQITYPTVYDRAVKYVESATPGVLDGVESLSKSKGFRVPRPSLSQPWTIKDGNLYVGGTPVVMNGPLWTFNGKDMSYKLEDIGLNTQAFETGPSFVMGDVPYQALPDLMNVDRIAGLRRYITIGQSANEASDMLVAPHYLPAWFEKIARGQGELDGYGYLDTDEGRRMMSAYYDILTTAYADMGGVHTIDLANEWVFYSTSPRSMGLFRDWLRKKYGAIGRLNKVWKTAYLDFGDIPAPFSGPRPTAPEGVYTNRAPYWDWCRFNTQRAAGVLRWMNAEVKRRMPQRLTHVKCILSSREARSFSQNFEMGIDPQLTLPITDIIGTDASYVMGGMWRGTLFAYDYMKSICPNKPICCSEMHIVPYRESTPGELRRGLFQRVIHGERLNTLFNCTTIGVPEWWQEGVGESSFNIHQAPDVLESFALTSADLRRLAGRIARFGNTPPTVGLFYDNAADFGVPGTANPPGGYLDRAVKVYESLIPVDARVGVITESMLIGKSFHGRLLVFAGAEYVSDKALVAIQAFVKGGGSVLLVNRNFGFDEYGAERDQAKLRFLQNNKRVMRVASPEDCAGVWSGAFRTAGVSPSFSIVGRDGKRPADVEILSAADGATGRLVFLANAGTGEAELRLTGAARVYTDLLTGDRVDPARVRLAKDQVMLLEAAK